MSADADLVRETHLKAMEALGADVHPYSASAIRDWEQQLEESLARLEARIARLEGALRETRMAVARHINWGEDQVADAPVLRRAIENLDAALAEEPHADVAGRD